MLRTIFDAPAMRPPASLTGDTDSETSTRLPFFRRRTVSKWSMRSPRPDPRQDARLLLMPIEWDQNGDRLADHLFRGITEQRLRAGVPCRDDAVEVLRQDGVVRRFHDRRQTLRGQLRVIPLGDVDQDADRTGQRARGVEQGVG